MAQPIIDKITDNIVTVLGTIDAGSVYTHTLEVERAKREGNTPAPATAGNIKAVLHRSAWRPDPDAPIQHNQRFQRYDVVCYVFEPASATTVDDVNVSILEAELEKALMADPNRGTNTATGNKLAIDTIILGGSPFPPPPSEVQAHVFSFEVRYRTQIDNPFSQ